MEGMRISSDGVSVLMFFDDVNSFIDYVGQTYLDNERKGQQSARLEKRRRFENLKMSHKTAGERSKDLKTRESLHT